MLHPGRTCIT